jgi:hypothetical protein
MEMAWRNATSICDLARPRSRNEMFYLCVQAQKKGTDERKHRASASEQEKDMKLIARLVYNYILVPMASQISRRAHNIIREGRGSEPTYCRNVVENYTRWLTLHFWFLHLVVESCSGAIPSLFNKREGSWEETRMF